MKHLFNPKVCKGLWALLIVLLVVKLLWFLVEVLWLPTSGIDHVAAKGGQSPLL